MARTKQRSRPRKAAATPIPEETVADTQPPATENETNNDESLLKSPSKRGARETNNESLLKSPTNTKNGGHKESRPSSPLVKQRKTAKKRLEELNEQLKDVIRRMEHAEPTDEDRAEIEAEVKGVRDDAEKKNKKELESIQNAQKECKARLKDLAKEENAADKRVKDLQKAKAKKEAESEGLKSEADALEEDLAALEESLKQATDDLANAEKDRDETTETLDRMEQNFADLDDKLAKMTAEKNKQMSLVDALDEELALYEQEENIRNARNNGDIGELKKSIKEVPKKFENEFKQLKAASENDILSALNHALARHTKELQEKNDKALEEATVKHNTDEGVILALDTKLKELKAAKKDLDVQNHAATESQQTTQDLTNDLEDKRAKLVQLHLAYDELEKDCAKKKEDEAARYHEVDGHRKGVEAVQAQLEKSIEEYAKLLEYASNGFKRKNDGSDEDASFLRPSNKRARVDDESFHVTITGIVSLKAVDPKGTKIVLENQTEDLVDLSGWHLVGVSHDEQTAQYDFDEDATLNARATLTIYTDAADYDRAIGAAYLWDTDPIWAANKQGSSRMKLYNKGGLVSAATITLDKLPKQSEGCCIM